MRHAQPSGGGRKHESRPSSPSADTDSDSLHRPSFSDATPRPTPSQPRPIAQDSSTLDAPASKRLAFFADKLSGTSSSQGHHHHQQSASTFSYRPSPVPSHPNGSLIPPRSHSRTDSAISSLSPMASSSSTTNASKVHISPSKVSPSQQVYLPVLTPSSDSQRPAEHMTPDSSRVKCTVLAHSPIYPDFLLPYLLQPLHRRLPSLPQSAPPRYPPLLQKETTLGAVCMFMYCPYSTENLSGFLCEYRNI